MSTPTDPGPQKTGQQLRGDLIAAVTAGIAASGIPDGWSNAADIPWNPETDEFTGQGCSAGASGSTRRERFDIDLYHPPVGDPLEFVKMMGEYWEGQGYIVSNVITPVTHPDGRKDAVNRADRADGSLAAGATASDRQFVLSFYTECSTDPTLKGFSGPKGYRTFDPLEQNPYHPTNSPTITPYPRPATR